MLPSATNRASADWVPAAPSKRVVTSSSVRSSASARRTSIRPSWLANRQHPVDSAACACGDVSGHAHLVLQVAKRARHLFQGYLLNVAAFRRFARGQEFLVGVLPPQALPYARPLAHPRPP